MTHNPTQLPDLFQEIRHLIDAAKHRAATALNTEITLLYWQVGQRIQTEILQGQRWSEKQLRHCLHFAEIFPEEQIVSALRRQLTWTHIRTLIYQESPQCSNPSGKLGWG